MPDDLAALHQHPLLHRIYAARGVTNDQELDYDLKHLFPYDKLRGIDQAVACLATVLCEQQSVLVVGDFDTDGATSTALAILALRALGLKNIAYLIPNRFEYGYGLTPEVVVSIATEKPDLIMTVDNGINSIDGVNAANQLGIKVLVTDHHLPGDGLPRACAIVNPNQKDDEFASKSLAGVGVVFYLMVALRAYLRSSNWFAAQNIAEPNLAQYLDLVALGTIADAVNLDRNNRILVMQGLQRVKSRKCCLGIKALFAVAKRNYEKVTASDFGFVIAPRLNAAGRLDDMSLGVEILLTDDPVRARSIAKELDKLNDERRILEVDMQHQASRLVENLQLEQTLPPGLCVFEESWHQGILGILAGRLKDKLHRPVIAFTAVGDDQIKGSARSVNNVHLRDVLASIAEAHPGLIAKFGGHAMAAGLSLARSDYETFTQVFAAEVRKHLTLEDLHGAIHIDGELPPQYFDLGVAELLAAAGPWGAGFVEPIFYGEFALVSQCLVGKKHLKLVLRHLVTGQEVNAICFNINPGIWPNPLLSKIKIIYRLSVNEYRSRRSLQLIISEVVGYE